MTKKQIHAAERYDETRHGERAGLFSASARAYDQAKDEEEGNKP